jgi:hypothetical protein
MFYLRRTKTAGLALQMTRLHLFLLSSQNSKLHNTRLRLQWGLILPIGWTWPTFRDETYVTYKKYAEVHI